MKILITILALIGIFLLYKEVNERQKTNILKNRTQKLKIVDKYEFNRSLYKVRVARQKMLEKIKDSKTKTRKIIKRTETSSDEIHGNQESKEMHDQNEYSNEKEEVDDSEIDYEDLHQDEPSIAESEKNPEKYTESIDNSTENEDYVDQDNDKDKEEHFD